jgi:CxxC-x17-CxxC domain-containing protein
MENDITYFGKTNFRGQEHVFGIKRDDRRRHMYVIGKTGMGKSNLLKNMIISDIQAGNGLAVVDPHGDLAEDVLSFIPPNRVNDVVYFNPADIDFPIAFNVMEHVDPKYRHLVASGLIGVFKKIWADSWGPRLEYLLRNAILALLEYPDSTLLGVTRILIDDDYRKKVVGKVSDPVVKTFWMDEFTKYSKQFMVEAIAPIQNKVGQFLSSSLVRNIVSQPHSSIDMRDIMDNQKIFIINLAKGRIGEDYSALLGAMLITKIQLAAMGRVDTPEPDRKDFYLYVDEFQNFATESFAGILSEARKYRLDLIVAHQYIGQLEEEVRDAIFGNVGTIVTFRVGATDAEYLEKEFEPIFMMNDLVNLAKYEMYLKLMIDGVSGDAFSADSLPPIQMVSTSDPEKIIKVSRERYTKKREVVEDKVARWSGYIKEEGSDEWTKEVPARENSGRSGGNNSPAAPKADDRQMWDAVCASCSTNIKVPFQPDPSRQTYCKDCLTKVRQQVTAATTKAPSEVQPAARQETPRPVERSEERMVQHARETVMPQAAPQPTPQPAAQAKPVAAPAQAAVSAPESAPMVIPRVQDVQVLHTTPGQTVPVSAAQKTQPVQETVRVVRQETIQKKQVETHTMRREVPETAVPAPEKKIAYDPQKMIELFETRRREAEEKEKTLNSVSTENLETKTEVPQPKPVEALVAEREASVEPKPKLKVIMPKPAQDVPPVISLKEKKVEEALSAAPQPSNATPLTAKEIKAGEVIKFD